MSMVPRCPRCDARTDPYGRDGGHSYCTRCREEIGITDYIHESGFSPDAEVARARRAA
jgi:tRNA(Ile2) C34 agmatinyltransferase TiaS